MTESVADELQRLRITNEQLKQENEELKRHNEEHEEKFLELNLKNYANVLKLKKIKKCANNI